MAFLKIRQKSRARAGKPGQSSLEMALAIIGVMLLIIGTLQIFIWLNKRFILRQQAYESTRVDAASADTPGAVEQIDDTDFPKLEIFR